MKYLIYTVLLLLASCQINKNTLTMQISTNIYNSTMAQEIIIMENCGLTSTFGTSWSHDINGWSSGYGASQCREMRTSSSYYLNPIYSFFKLQVTHCYDTEIYYGSSVGDRLCLLFWTNSVNTAPQWSSVWYGTYGISWDGIQYNFNFKTDNYQIPSVFNGKSIYIFFSLQTDSTYNSYYGEVMKSFKLLAYSNYSIELTNVITNYRYQ